MRLLITARDGQHVTPETGATRGKEAALEGRDKESTNGDEESGIRAGWTPRELEGPSSFKAGVVRATGRQDAAASAVPDPVGRAVGYAEKGDRSPGSDGIGISARVTGDDEEKPVHSKRSTGLRGLPPDSTMPTSQIIAEFIARHFPHIGSSNSWSTPIEGHGPSLGRESAANARQASARSEAAGRQGGAEAHAPSTTLAGAPSTSGSVKQATVSSSPLNDDTVVFFTQYMASLRALGLAGQNLVPTTCTLLRLWRRGRAGGRV